MCNEWRIELNGFPYFNWATGVTNLTATKTYSNATQLYLNSPGGGGRKMSRDGEKHKCGFKASAS